VRIILLIAIPLLLIIGIGIFTQGMLQRDANEITGLLDQLEEQVRTKDWEKAAASLDQISKAWQPARDKWQALIDHFETDRIDEAFSRLKAYIHAEEDEECLAEIAVLKQTFLHIPEKERLNFSNIF
jgi:hypothetical protein